MNHKLPILLFCIIYLEALQVDAQVNARLFQTPDVSATQITFAYAGDIWIVPKSGGTASRLSSPPGPESFPKFSPDGSRIAFSGNYDGSTDVYVIPSLGGLPVRLTYHGMDDRVVDWTNAGDKVLFASSRKSGRQRFNQFYLISREGGLAEKLPMPYAEFGCFSPDGQQIVYTDKSRLSRTWKRYRGGWAPDLILFNLTDSTSHYLTQTDANEELPMWHGNKIYFLSDRGAEKRFNIWSYNVNTNQVAQLTTFADFDVHWPSIGPEDIVFEAGGYLYLMDLENEQYKEVNINVVTDLMPLTPRTESVEKYISGASVGPDGNRVAVEARGDIFSLPAEHGFIKDLTNTSGIAERNPAWSPDGMNVAYWSDRSGEYELYLRDVEKGTEKKMTSYGPGYRYQPSWSPDSKKIAFIDQAQKIWVYDLTSNTTKLIDQGLWMTHGGLQRFEVSWSSDSRWLAYDRGLDNRANSIFIYDVKNDSSRQVTSSFYSDSRPSFDPDGKYLYFLTNRHFAPVYSDFGNEFVYPNSTVVAAVSLRKDVPSALAPRNDAIEMKKDEDKEGNKNDEEEDSSKKKKNKDKSGKEEESGKKEEKAVDIDFDHFESRAVLLPVSPGNYSDITAVSGKIIYHQRPNSGSGSEQSPIKYFDLKDREEKTIIDDADGYEVTADGKKMLVAKNRKLAIIDIAAGQKMDKPLRTDEMEMVIIPKEEYRQIFNDAWRFERDYFYDPGMHGVDWKLMKDRYGKLIDDAVTRWDVNYILGELIGELSSSHTYKGGGDTEKEKSLNVGYLGVDWELDNGYYRIKRIITPPVWEVETRSPLSRADVDVHVNDYVLAVNGIPLDIAKEPYAAFQGLGGKSVELTVNSKPDFENARKVVVELLSSETALRHLDWIEQNRKRVEDATDGKVGYVYVPNTGIEGQSELLRQFSSQYNKEGLIIDERFNSGGQIPDRFIELLNRKPLAYWAVRSGRDWSWPPIAHFGPQVMLINGWSGSGGDAFPYYFREANLGPLVGMRTWGGLIGISGVPGLIDGGVVTVPTFRMYDPDGTWFQEGHGVEPDVKVPEDAGMLAKGTDVQLEKGIEEVTRLINTTPYVKPEHPPYQTR